MQPESTTPATKVCTKCGRELPLSEFTRAPRSETALMKSCRHCKRIYNAAYHAAHREKLRLRCAAYDAAHLEERRAYAATHREEQSARNAAWNAAHPEENRIRWSAYHEAHREEQRAYTRAWHAAHPEESRAQCRNRRARLVAATGHHTAADVAAQRTRQKGCCYYCGEQTGRHYHVDHVVPLSLGGSNGPENLVIACASCNLRTNAKHPMDFGGRLF